MTSRVKRLANAHEAAIRSARELNGIRRSAGTPELFRLIDKANLQAEQLEETLREAIVEDAMIVADAASARAKGSA